MTSAATGDAFPLGVAELAGAIARGEISAEATTRAALDAIAKQTSLGAFLTVSSERALETARAIDARRAKGEPLGPLAGVPIGIKDALVTVDAPTTAGSRILLREDRDPPDASLGYRSPYDATCVARLRAADAVLIGKCNLDEFAMGSSTENSAFFPARNPHDPERIPGGSSGGSAVAVAAGMASASLGSDTGGSIRQPASLTGVVGVKPTYGRVSRYGLIAFASSLDQVGVFARDVSGAEQVLRVIAGHDPRDGTSLPGNLDSEGSQRASVEGLRIGVPREYFAEGLEPGVRAEVESAIESARAAGARIVPISLPHTSYALAAYYVIATAEASSNLARFDGVRYGLRKEGRSLKDLYEETRARGFGAEVKRRIMLGTFVLSAGYYDAYYLRAQKVRTLIVRDFQAAFAEVDVIAAPTSPTVAFRIGERTDDPLSMYLADVCTLPSSLAGLPALSLPCGWAAPGDDSAKLLPVGLQLIAPPLAERLLFEAARGFEALVAPRINSRRTARDASERA